MTRHRHIHALPRGISLIETIVTAAIVGVLAAVSLPSFLQWLEQRRVDDALVRVEGALKESQREAIKRNTTCAVTIPQGENQTITGDCFVTGDRRLEGVLLSHNRDNNWQITFDFKGRNNDPAQAGSLWLDSPNGGVQPRCLVISFGIGLMRTGNYDPQSSTCATS